MGWQHGFCKTLSWFHVFFLLYTFSSVSGKVFSEKTILVEFRNSISDPSGILSSWNSNTSDHCSWYGVSCDSKSRISELNIAGVDCKRGNSRAFSSSSLPQFPFYGFGIRRTCSCSNGKLVGKLSPLIGKLAELRVLSLPFNEFSGEIPIEIWGLENLEVLDLEGNLFTGNLPNRFDGLRKLRVFNLGFNRINGKVPFSLMKCVGLHVLNLAGNEVNGRIPGFLSSFTELRGLYLSFNQLTGNVSGLFGNNCQNLKHIDLSGNFLIGGIPRSLGKCRRLKTLLLFSNKFDDVIPRELGQLRMLEVLDVSRNSLTGPIPVELGNCVELSVIVLSNLFDPLYIRSTKGEAMSGLSSPSNYDHNHFQGSIPVEITTLPKLKVIWAPRATLQGKFPTNWGRCDSLEMVNVAENFFDGELTGVFGPCKSLNFLNLSSNRLTGKLDEKLPVPCMSVFDVSENFMSGSIPSFNYNICPHKYSFNADPIQHNTLSFAYLLFFTYKSCSEATLPFLGASFVMIHNFGGNNFSGPIPRLPVVLARLRRQTDYAFLAGGNKLTGPFPGKFFEKCNGLNGLIANFSNNKISGQIPLDIGTRCRSLKVLDASENQISGSIPQSLGNMGHLALLDLSSNKLQGKIPVGLGQLKYLKYLSLSGNNLTGVIPSSFELLRSLEVLALSSNSFSGEIPQSLVKLRNLTVLLLNNNKLSGQIPSGLADSTSLSTFNVSCNYLSEPLLLKNDVMNCTGGVFGNPLLRFSRILSVSVPYPNLEGGNVSSQNYAASTPGNVTNSKKDGLTSIEIACVISASAIFSVLLALVVLCFYTRKWTPNSSVQVSESREITLFTDIGFPLTYENIVQATGCFNSSNCIGFGGFGATYKAEINPGTLVAVKKLSVGRFQLGVQQFHAEIKTLERVRHPNLVTLIGYHASETEMFLIYNYLPGGNLEEFIHERSEKAVDWKILHKIALHVAKALAYLHDPCRVLHRDVKPSNILLDNELNAYLSDFGLSRLLGNSETHATTGVAGTFGYVAPEYALTCRVSEKSDVYSYGVVLLELISDKKALDPSFSSHGDGFNIVSWACLLLRHGRAKDVFKTRLWDSGPHDKLVDALHLAVRCTVDSLTIRPTMKQVVQQLIQLQPPSS